MTVNDIDPDLAISSVTLAVSDLERSSDFYERVLGLPSIARDADRSLLGHDAAQPALKLIGLERPVPIPARSTGLFHVAWLHPTRAGLAASVGRVLASGWPLQGASDHGVSEALYLSDPDGLGIELYADRPRELWERPPGGRGVNMVTLPLDMEDLLAQLEGEPSAAIEPGTRVGHVHFKVSDVPRAAAFYAETLGFSEQARMPSAAFLAAGGYHHHIGLNSWQSTGGSAPPESAPGSREVAFELQGSDTLEQLARDIAGAPSAPALTHDESGGLLLRDPDSQMLRFTGSRQD